MFTFSLKRFPVIMLLAFLPENDLWCGIIKIAVDKS